MKSVIERRWRSIRYWLVFVFVFYGILWAAMGHTYWVAQDLLLVSSEALFFLFLFPVITWVFPKEYERRFIWSMIVIFLSGVIFSIDHPYIYSFVLGFLMAAAFPERHDDDDEFKKWLEGSSEEVRKAVAAMNAVWAPVKA